MESKLMKPSGLKKPSSIPKTILPTERLRANTNILKSAVTSRVPLARDVSNFTTVPTRAHIRGSPELSSAKPPVRARLRRSRSVGDLREAISRPLKRTDNTLAPIPSKIGRSVSDLREIALRPLKRTDPTLAPIPSKVGKLNSSSNFVALSRNGLSVNKFKSGKVDTSIKSNSSIAKKPSVTATKTATKKIPAYDYKARFNDLLEKHKVLKEKYEESREQLSTLDSLPEQYEECQEELFAIKEELKGSKSEVECLQRQNVSQKIKIASLTKCLQDTKDEFDKLSVQFQIVSKEHAEMTIELKELRQKYSVKLTDFTTISDELEVCKDQLFRANLDRKNLHNAVMDLRGNIRVFCRVRPALECEGNRMLCGWNYIDETTLEIQNLEVLASGAKNKVGSHIFSFDHIFHPKSTQEDIIEMVAPLIQSALDGYNICIFAYGQTGSGKTYTMDGVAECVGVIPRTVDLLFEAVKNYKRFGWEYEIKATFLEIYNEVLYDLLSNEQKEMEIRMAKNKTDIYVSNITEETVETANRLRHLMNIAKMNRATAATVGNERSSRSHAVTRIELIGRHDEKSEISIGTLNLVDLAGSESPKTSIRMNETKNINRSLSELTNVILALLQKQDHIPYRNSKLTHLLMPSLGGNSKTLMFINVAPFQDCFVESVKSLRFAASVNSCKLAKAKKNKFLNTSNSGSL